jgi:hypothetical protein
MASEIVKVKELSTAAIVDLFASGNITNTTLVITPENPEETAKKIALRDLNAASVDELLGGGANVINGKTYLNKPFLVESVEWQQSDFEGEGLPFYAVCHIVDLEGESHVLTCGATTVVRKLAVMAHNDWFPQWVKITKGPKTAAGYEPLDLVKAPAPEKPF